MSKLTSNTLMPIGLAVISIGGGAAWMTKINLAVDADAAKIVETESHYKEMTELLRQIDHRLSVIEGEVKRIRK